MKTKILLLIFTIIFLSNIVSALLTDNLIAYYTADNTDTIGQIAIDKLGHYNASGSHTITTGITGKIGESYRTDGTSRLITFIPSGTTNSSYNWTINFWANLTDGNAFDGLVGCFDNGNNGIEIDFRDGYSNNYTMSFSGSNVPTTIHYSTNWQMITLTYNEQTDNATIYINSTNIYSATKSSWSSCGANLTFGNSYGTSAGDTNGLVGGIDEMAVWSRTLNNSEITTIWNGGAGLPYTSYTTIIPTDLYLTAQNEWDSSSINSFNVSITWNNGTTQTNTTTTGSIYLQNVSNTNMTYNITYSATNYFSRTYTNQELLNATNNTLTGSIHQAEICFNATQKVSNASIIPNNITINSVVRNTANFCYNLSSGNYNVMAQKTSWWSKNQTFTVSALQNSTETITDLFSTIANISIYQSNGTILSVYGIKINNSNYPSWIGENGSTTTGSFLFNGTNSTYQITINSTLGNETFNITITTAPRQNFSYYYFTLTNCTPMSQVVLNFTILNEDDNTLLNDSAFDAWFNITSQLFIGEKYFNITRSTGNYYIVCIPNNTITNFTANAQIKYSKLTTYAEKNYYLIDYLLYNLPIMNIPLYLTNGTTQIKLQVRDYTDAGISNVYIKVLSYDLGTNSYRTTEIVKTDSDGNAYAQLVANTAWYAFILQQNGAIILQTLPTKITSSPQTFRITTGYDYFNNYDVIKGMSYSLTYDNSSSTFSFTYNEPTGAVNQGCLRLTQRSINGDLILNTTCVTSNAGTILLNITGVPGDNTYIADAYAFIGGESFTLNTSSTSANNTYKLFGTSGLFFSMLIIITLTMVGIWHPAIAIVMMIFGVITTNVIGLFYMNWTYIITFIILGVLTMYRVGRSE